MSTIDTNIVNASASVNTAGLSAVTANITTANITTANITTANITNDMKVTGNVYTGAVENQTVSMGYVPYTYLTSNTTLTWTGLPPTKVIKLESSGLNVGAGTNVYRIYLSSDSGVNYGSPHNIGPASGGANLASIGFLISNTAIAGANKSIISRAIIQSGATTPFLQLNVESTITGVINAVKINSSGVLSITSPGGVVIYGEV